MKLKIVIVILILICIGLGLALFATKKQGEELHTQDIGYILDFSNQVVAANVELKDMGQVNLALTNDLALSHQESMDLSNSLASAAVALASAKTNLASAQGEITNLNLHLSDLEEQNRMLDQHAAELTNTIAQMNALIADTESKLMVAETNTSFLQGELQKQMTQKAELEHKFNDVNEVRTQVKKLKDEMFIARHIQLNKNDNSGRKGAEMLTSRTPPPSTNAPAKLPPNYDLNVEVGSDGSVKVIPPMGATNPAAH
ncbi:MAG TPA: hypothetical protein VG347_09690 [Verrucomicrobiae bacterium]|nr:hypothetical protein [Verrucomicrobiae bacterium]